MDAPCRREMFVMWFFPNLTRTDHGTEGRPFFKHLKGNRTWTRRHATQFIASLRPLWIPFNSFSHTICICRVYCTCKFARTDGLAGMMCWPDATHHCPKQLWWCRSDDMGWGTSCWPWTSCLVSWTSHCNALVPLRKLWHGLLWALNISPTMIRVLRPLAMFWFTWPTPFTLSWPKPLYVRSYSSHVWTEDRTLW